jgi:hypothetical protein
MINWGTCIEFHKDQWYEGGYSKYDDNKLYVITDDDITLSFRKARFFHFFYTKAEIREMEIDKILDQ